MVCRHYTFSSLKYLNWSPHSSSIRESYSVFLVISNYDLCSPLVTVMLDATAHQIGRFYNSTYYILARQGRFVVVIAKHLHHIFLTNVSVQARTKQPNKIYLLIYFALNLSWFLITILQSLSLYLPWICCSLSYVPYSNTIWTCIGRMSKHMYIAFRSFCGRKLHTYFGLAL